MKKKKTALLLYGATDFGASQFSVDLLWRTGGFKIPDPTLFIEIEGRSFLFASSLEIGRAKKEAKVDEVIHLRQKSDFFSFLKEKNVLRITIPADIPYRIGKELERRGFLVRISPSRAVYRERMIKTDAELREITKAQRANERSVKKAVDFLTRCRVRGNRIYNGKVEVSAEMVRCIIDDDLYAQGYLGTRSIVACGCQAADPHNEGSGPLLPYAPIVMDVYPVSRRTNYWADMTRTVFKGNPSAQMKKMYMAVLQAQLRALKKVRAGIDGRIIQEDIERFFELRGFPTDLSADPPHGFIHSVGHGIGIELHEEPHIASHSSILAEGSVVTVEPGLYYPEIGGIRIEDMVVVMKNGCRNLTRFSKKFNDIVL